MVPQFVQEQVHVHGPLHANALGVQLEQRLFEGAEETVVQFELQHTQFSAVFPHPQLVAGAFQPKLFFTSVAHRLSSELQLNEIICCTAGVEIFDHE